MKSIIREFDSTLSDKKDLSQSIMHEVLRYRSIKSANDLAFDTKEKTGKIQPYTWADFYQQALRTAYALRKLGLHEGECLAVISPNGLQWESLFYGALMNRSIVVGIETHATFTQMAAILENSKAKILAVHDLAILKRLPCEAISQLKAVINLGNRDSLSSELQVIPWDEIMNFEEAQLTPLQGSSDAPALLVYTSGTTGTPKGILYSQRQLVETALEIAQTLGDGTSEDRFVCWLPVANLFQRMMNLCALILGAKVSLLADPLSVVDELSRIKPTFFIGVPRFYEKVAERIQSKLHWIPKFAQKLSWRVIAWQIRKTLGGHIRYMISGSAPLSLRAREFFESAGIPIFEAYGLSENVLPVAMNTPSQNKVGSVGKPLDKNIIKMTEEGEILIKGPSLAKGYFHSEDRSKWDDEGFFHTGDLGYMDEEGFLFLTGRKGDIIKTSSGRKVAPVAIETTIRELDPIDDVVIIGHGRKQLMGLLVLKKKDKPCSQEEMNDLKKALIASMSGLHPWEQVRCFLVLSEELSIQKGLLTANLKVKRSAVEKYFAEDVNHLETSWQKAVAEMRKSTSQPEALPVLLVEQDKLQHQKLQLHAKLEDTDNL